MKIIYALAIEEDGLQSREEKQWLSALVGHLETQAHRWMMDHHPDVELDTQRIAPTVSRQTHCRLGDGHKHHRVLADTDADRARGEQILAELHEYIRHHWKAWRVERVVGGRSPAHQL